MAYVHSFQDLEVYKEATLFWDAIWGLICTMSLQKDYRLRRKIHGSSCSIKDNIAVGFRPVGNQIHSFCMFTNGAISEETYHLLNSEAQNLIDQPSKFINYLKKSERRGPKFD